MKKFLIIFVLGLTAAGCSSNQSAAIPNPAAPIAEVPTSTLTKATPTPIPTTASASTIANPISNALSRVTKKPFGIYITKENSPVQPEKFSGYHTGVDFETTSEEQNVDVPIDAVCDGPLKMKKWASGYGGVAVQGCTINNQAVTIIYGHLNLTSVTVSSGQQLKAGDNIGNLGKGYSTETDGERKHLHLGIHKGVAINILGYVQNKNDLQNWLDGASILKK